MPVLKVLLSGAVVAAGLLFASASFAASHPGEGNYVIRYDHWSESDERDFSQFVQLIGDSGCPTVDACLKGPWNPYRASDPASIHFYSDCAQFPYVLRAYFAWKRGLPFSYESGVAVRGGGADPRYSQDGNVVTARTDVRTGSTSGPALLQELQRAISTASYRMHPDIDSPLPPDFYSAALGPKSIHPGTVIYDPNGHAALVTRVDRDGRIAFIDSHPDNTVTHEYYDLRFVRSRPGQGAGFKNWRPLRLVDYHAGSDGALEGGHDELARNRDIPDYSDEQYYGNGQRPGDDNWADSTFTLNGEQMDYYDYVRAKAGGGKLEFDPVKEVAEMVDSNCNDLHYRAQAVDIAIQAGIQNRSEPDRLPRNIYGTNGDWEAFSTPSRDARLKTAFKELRDKAERFVGMYERGDTKHLVYSGTDIVGDMLAAYDDGVAKCTVSYTRSDGQPVTLTYEQARQRLFKMSFDPYECIERRWGAADEGELSSCRDGDNKRAWYDAEQDLRNQIDRTYDARMDFSLADLGTPGPGKGVPTPPDTDVHAYLVSMQGKVASPAQVAQNAPQVAAEQPQPTRPGLIPTPVVTAPPPPAPVDPEEYAAQYAAQKKQQDAADLAEWRTARQTKFADWQARACDGRVASNEPIAPSGCTPTSSAPRAIGEVWDMAEAPEMMVLPAGGFTMGSPPGEPGRKINESPEHHVEIPRSFAVSKTLVTFHEWDTCVAEGGCKGYSPMDAHWGRGKQPVINVNVSDAEAYAAWLSAKTGHHYRLLTEAEWEYAARAGTETPFWWGSTINTDEANYDAPDFPTSFSEGGKYLGAPSPVDKYPANPFGLMDMGGNVWQWTADCWNENYAGAPNIDEAWRRGDCNRRVVRGGAFNNTPAFARSAFRFWEVGDLRSALVGFRVARDM